MKFDQSLLGQSPGGLSQPKPNDPLIIVVDDDLSVRVGLCELIESAGLQAAPFGSAGELLDADVLGSPGCLILDVRLPGSSGLDLQRHLVQAGNFKPIIFLTGHGDVPMTVEAMKAGAVNFFTKPVRDQTLLDAVFAGLAIDGQRRNAMAKVRKHIESLTTLTQREWQVFREVARGRLNKQIAFDLGISEVTVKLHRSNVMRKMQFSSVGELIRAWESLPAEEKQANTRRAATSRVVESVETAFFSASGLHLTEDTSETAWK